MLTLSYSTTLITPYHLYFRPVFSEPFTLHLYSVALSVDMIFHDESLSGYIQIHPCDSELIVSLIQSLCCPVTLLVAISSNDASPSYQSWKYRSLPCAIMSQVPTGSGPISFHCLLGSLFPDFAYVQNAWFVVSSITVSTFVEIT